MTNITVKCLFVDYLNICILQLQIQQAQMGSIMRTMSCKVAGHKVNIYHNIYSLTPGTFLNMHCNYISTVHSGCFNLYTLWPCFMFICFTPFLFNAPLQFTLLDLCPLVISLTLSGWFICIYSSLFILWECNFRSTPF